MSSQAEPIYLRKSFSPSRVPEMSSPVSVTILSLTPGEEAVAFTIDDGDVMPKPPSTVLRKIIVKSELSKNRE